MTNTMKKVGRRKAGSYGRPGSKKMKRAASKGVRVARKKESTGLAIFADILNSPFRRGR